MGNLRIQSFSSSMQLDNIGYATRKLKTKKFSLLQTVMLDFLGLVTQLHEKRHSKSITITRLHIDLNPRLVCRGRAYSSFSSSKLTGSSSAPPKRANIPKNRQLRFKSQRTQAHWLFPSQMSRSTDRLL